MKKIMIYALCLTLVFLVGCGETGNDLNGPFAGSTNQATHAETAPLTDPTHNETVPSTSSAPAERDPAAPAALNLSVREADGQLSIERPELPDRSPMGKEGTWTIFVYLCGSDLESESGMATDDLIEMCDALDSDKVRFVIQTGGSRTWWNYTVSEEKNQRWLVEGDDITLLQEGSRVGMGRAATLTDFLTWGVANYPAARMGVIFWDHGGGSITGVCFDETDRQDSLSLREIDAALLSVYGTMTDKFEFIGFDACLMGTLETANILASYARYMYGSEETEPGSGWDYAAIGSYLAKNPNADGAALGRQVCDSFYTACKAVQDERSATLSVIDLSRMDALLQAFNSFSDSLYQVSEDQTVLTELIRGIWAAENFGGNNKTEGYTNMVDLGGIVKACAAHVDGADAVLSALDEAVVYAISGSDHTGATGLATYYPLEVQGSEEMTIFTDLCVSPYYLSFIDRQGHGSVSSGETDGYDSGTWFDNGTWSWDTDYSFNEDNIDWNEWWLLEQWEDWDYSYGQENEDYWSYIDDYYQTGDSALITFEEPPQLDEDGYYYFVLDDEGYNNTADVYAWVFELSEDGEDLIDLGETYDLQADWDYGYFCDDFDGYWLSLPDGQNLALSIVDITDDYILYSSPIELNGEETNLRFRQSWDGEVTVEGAWDGIDEYGAAARNIIKLQKGDVIVPLYDSYTVEDFELGSYYGQDYTLKSDELQIQYDYMESGDYLYCFCIYDIYGDYYLTDFVTYCVEEDGSVSFYLE
jgi:Clostripain family.